MNAKYTALGLGIMAATEWYIFELFDEFVKFEPSSFYGIASLVCAAVFLCIFPTDFKNIFRSGVCKSAFFLSCIVPASLFFYVSMGIEGFIDDDYNLAGCKFLLYTLFIVFPAFVFKKRVFKSLPEICVFVIATAGFLLLAARPETLLSLYLSKDAYYSEYYRCLVFFFAGVFFWGITLVLIKKNSVRYPITEQVIGILFFTGILNFVGDYLSTYFEFLWTVHSLKLILSVTALYLLLFSYLIFVFKNRQAGKVNNRGAYLLLGISGIYAVYNVMAGQLSKGEFIGCLLIIISLILQVNEMNLLKWYSKTKNKERYYIRGFCIFSFFFLLFMGLYYYLPVFGLVTAAFIDLKTVFYIPHFTINLEEKTVYFLFGLCALLISQFFCLQEKNSAFREVIEKYGERAFLLIVNLVISSAVTHQILFILDTIADGIGSVNSLPVRNAGTALLVFILVSILVNNIKNYNIRALVFTFAINVSLLEDFIYRVINDIYYFVFRESFYSFLFNIPYYTENLMSARNVFFIVAVLIEIFPALVGRKALKRIFYHTGPYRKAEDEERCLLNRALNGIRLLSQKEINKLEVLVSDSNVMNAYSVDKDTLIVTVQLLRNMSVPEIAAIIAHEMGHGSHKDTFVKMMIRVMNYPYIAIVNFLAYPLRVPRNRMDCIKILLVFSLWHFVLARYQMVLTGLFLILITRVVLEIPVVILSHLDERISEYAADRYACEIGLGCSLLAALRKFEEEDRDENFFNRLLNGHPRIDQRIGQIEQWLSKHASSINSEAETV